MQAANKVALNTGILYMRMLLTMGISLYATRLVLNALGQTDYGIFNLIAGVIAMLSFLNTAMATSTQRYLSFHQGKKDLAMQKKVFGNSVLLHLFIGVLIVLVLETAGAFLLNGFLKIPADRLGAANTVYHYMSVTVLFTIVSVPFLGSLTAHENMLWVAVVSIIETLLKLGIAMLLFVVSIDKLVVYGLLTTSISAFSLVLYAVYCFKKYPECQFKEIKMVDRGILKELSSFAGWNLFGSLCAVARSQGLAIVLNLFFGAVINAAYGIANQVSAQLTFFSSTMLRAINPQIMKSEGADDRNRMLRLSMMASKFGFFLLALFAIPCIFEMQNILQVWLKDVPENTAIFCQLILIGSLTNQLTIGLQSAAQAVGHIKQYQSTVGSVILLNLPIAYLLLKLNLAPYSVLVSYICIEFIACSLRLYFLNKIAGLEVNVFLNRVIFKEFIPLAVTVSVCYLTTNYLDIPWRFLYTIVISSMGLLVTAYLSGLCSDERALINAVIKKLFDKFFEKKTLTTEFQKR